MIGEFSHDITDYPEGIVLPVNKPYRWTSADVIRKLKFAAFRHFRKKNLKVGHAGTLDPLATGVLLVCLGPACKRAQTLQDHDKEYIAGIRFGATTPSYDLEKDVDRHFPYDHITADAVREALKGFLGPQEQVAPLFSAKSVDGVRAYEMARKLYRSGRLAELDEAALETLHRSQITISELELIDFIPEGTDVPKSVATLGRVRGRGPQSVPAGNASSRINVADTSALGLPEAVIRIVCSKGTYIRAFARDLGEALGSGAHLGSLVRSRSGDYRLEDCLSMEQALDLLKEG
jgi:tRNA pseudouridine55 synthase